MEFAYLGIIFKESILIPKHGTLNCLIASDML